MESFKGGRTPSQHGEGVGRITTPISKLKGAGKFFSFVDQQRAGNRAQIAESPLIFPFGVFFEKFQTLLREKHQNIKNVQYDKNEEKRCSCSFR